ncbi:hypothetical protein NFI96_007875, partial [Prochilodus magdalenae]
MWKQLSGAEVPGRRRPTASSYQRYATPGWTDSFTVDERPPAIKRKYEEGRYQGWARPRPGAI